MNSENEDWVGGAWLAATYGTALVLPLAVVSHIGGRRATSTAEGITTETHVQSMRPAASLRGHLTFHLKHEVPHLELLSRLFCKIDPQELVDWAADEPSGQYARRAGFLYEFLTARQLPMRTEMAGAYVDALDAQKLVAASPAQAVPQRRWRVRDNMPGTRDFCPVIRQTAEALTMMALDVPALLHQLALEFGDELLMRSAVWMTLRESQASFALEGEADQQTRIGRFADALARRCGQGAPPLDHATLAELQSDILGQRTTLQQFGLRQSPVFVGEVVRLQELVHYIAPPAEDIAAMLAGMRTFLQRTQGQSPVLRSAVAAFGFVYIHPLADGNGRVHRFLINDILRRDGAVKDPMILPVSSMITSDQAERRAYDLILDELSRPLMRSVADLYAFAPTMHVYPDCVSSNFVFHGDDSARHVWRYPDLTKHVVYLARVFERTIGEDMREESRYLRSHTQARAAIKDIIEMPDLQIDRVIRSAQANQGKLSNLLAREIPQLEAPGVWAAIWQAIEDAFSPLH
ncbi:MAG: cell filamentation protein Fic [Betaproteobacteria bacterium HGW-Betaproteobacteria-18]|nr:MAG: cell filamentation protein Fic [Betaproteobacteria bacterium HGW-Betaproteobacteria-18]